MKTGVELIATEREEQIVKHGKTIKSPESGTPNFNPSSKELTVKKSNIIKTKTYVQILFSNRNKKRGHTQ